MIAATAILSCRECAGLADAVSTITALLVVHDLVLRI